MLRCSRGEKFFLLPDRFRRCRKSLPGEYYSGSGGTTRNQNLAFHRVFLLAPNRKTLKHQRRGKCFPFLVDRHPGVTLGLQQKFGHPAGGTEYADQDGRDRQWQLPLILDFGFRLSSLLRRWILDFFLNDQLGVIVNQSRISIIAVGTKLLKVPAYR